MTAEQLLPLDIEDRESLTRYLQVRGDLAPGQPLELFKILSGGVSNKTIWAKLDAQREWVIKQCLEKLRVQVDWFTSPERIHIEALALEYLPELTPEGTIPRLVFEDHPRYVIAMQAVPPPHENWKQMLLSGHLNLDHVRQFASILAGFHRGSSERLDFYQPLFGDRSFFETLRLEAYYGFAAQQTPEVHDFLTHLIDETCQQRLALTHGDYSPKNILIRHDRLIWLDHEVLHIGDPAFDIGFSTTHLLSKAHHLPELRDAFAGAAAFYWDEYRERCGSFALTEAYEARAVRHTLGCLMARVAGRSLLEYFSDAERRRQKQVVIELMDSPPAAMNALINRFIEGINRYA
ncbi:MAG: phosphotransferase [Anaerolineae bacterium]|nr:phosphotransferase [Anaerolineae bacterium]